MQNSTSKGSSIGTFIGVFVALLLAVGAWFIAPNVLVSITRQVGNASTLSPMMLRVIFTVICFIIGLVVTMLVLSIVKPKDGRTVAENKVEEERNKMREAQRLERQKNRR
jgi:uncharacterized ion transporter superfamily protein YfcC